MRVTEDEQRDLALLLYRPLLRAAFLLCPGEAEDLVQDVLVKVLLEGRRVLDADHPQAYARRMLVNVFLSRRRRRASTEVLVERPPDRLDARSADDAIADRDLLRRALAGLPPRQRLAVVLRHYEDLSEQAAAQAMGCSTGTVKSLTSRGLAGLRQHLPVEKGTTR